jgi:hypothetical protein
MFESAQDNATFDYECRKQFGPSLPAEPGTTKEAQAESTGWKTRVPEDPTRSIAVLLFIVQRNRNSYCIRCSSGVADLLHQRS